MELKLIEQSLGASEKCHHSFVEECWGQGPLIPLHFGKVGSNGKKKPPGRESYVLIQVGLVCIALVRIRGQGRDCVNNFSLWLQTLL